MRKKFIITICNLSLKHERINAVIIGMTPYNLNYNIYSVKSLINVIRSQDKIEKILFRKNVVYHVISG